jgi:hypothetical protein
MFQNSKILFFAALTTLLVLSDKVHASAFIFDQDAAAEGFYKVFDHSEVTANFWKDMQEVEIRNPLAEGHRNLIFGGSGLESGHSFGVGNATHYTANVLKASMPDLLADMNVAADLESLPDERFDTIIASNIPIGCFAPGCFINARRLLCTGGVFIVNNLDQKGQDPAAIDACLATFGFRSIRAELDNYRAQLESIGFTEEQFPFGEPETVWPCVYQKI